VSAYWTPDEGETVWLNRPDGRRLGVVVGHVEEGNRAGQPIIEADEDEPSSTLVRGKRKGDRFVIHPMFLLPFEYGGEDWKRAMDEGRVIR
jgi:hypothetical protein